MGLRGELAQELEITHRDFHHLLDSIPEALYHHPSLNPAWTNGDALYHIALGMTLINYEVWLTLHARGLLQAGLDIIPAGVLNRLNALLARRGDRITRQGLVKAYEAGHAGLSSNLRRMREADFERWVTIPAKLDIILSGRITVERLFRHVKVHFEAHVGQICQE